MRTGISALKLQGEGSFAHARKMSWSKETYPHKRTAQHPKKKEQASQQSKADRERERERSGESMSPNTSKWAKEAFKGKQTFSNRDLAKGSIERRLLKEFICPNQKPKAQQQLQGKFFLQCTHAPKETRTKRKHQQNILKMFHQMSVWVVGVALVLVLLLWHYRPLTAGTRLKATRENKRLNIDNPSFVVFVNTLNHVVKKHQLESCPKSGLSQHEYVWESEVCVPPIWKHWERRPGRPKETESKNSKRASH